MLAKQLNMLGNMTLGEQHISKTTVDQSNGLESRGGIFSCLEAKIEVKNKSWHIQQFYVSTG